MEVVALCSVLALLKVFPNRSQFFSYESVSLSCEQEGRRSDWTVKSNTSMHHDQACGSPCRLPVLYPMDTGAYWCESAAGECRSSSVSITVTDGALILDSPVLPVMEGDNVSLHCTLRTSSSSSSSSSFYREQLLLGKSSSSTFTIFNVSKSDEGHYSCEVSGRGRSALSRLSVSELPVSTPPSPMPPSLPLLARILLPALSVAVVLGLLALLLVCLRRKTKVHDEQLVSYVDVNFLQTERPVRHTGLESATIFYSSLNLNTT